MRANLYGLLIVFMLTTSGCGHYVLLWDVDPPQPSEGQEAR